ncbi:MAG: CvpA family protein [Oscillospiraceae bacterium]|jgi:hypothetical protein|nr:CvpA family protein [Oscillospiraceae bacterium]
MAEPIQVDFSGGSGRKAPQKKAPIIPPERAGLRVLLSLVGAVLTAAIGYYIMLPPLNFKALEFYYYLALVFGSFIVLLFLLCRTGRNPECVPYVRRKAIIPGAIIVVMAVFVGLAWVFSSPFFHATRYSEIMKVKENSNFAEDIKEPDFSSIPKMDETAAKVVAGRTLGDLAKHVSQFVISESNTLINYKKKPVRVMTLGYADLIKWLTNTGKGLPGYVVVDMASEESKFVELPEDGRIRYSDAEHFNHLLKRHLRFLYPTYMFGTPNFEIDDKGVPYWVAPRMNKTIGLLGGEDVVGVVLVNAITGKCAEYPIDKVPQWIDRVYNATLLELQYSYYGKYAGGFWNSLLGQKGVKINTQGYAYLAQDDDVKMYTGVTSVKGDQSIIGFIMVNQRTKETNAYRTNGANELSAEEVAQGLVSDLKWKASFPLLVNVSGQPTYFISLKDQTDGGVTGVVQGYAMVNVEQSNKIKVWAKDLGNCINTYVNALNENGIKADEVVLEEPPEGPDTTTPPAATTVIGTIADIRSAVINGNTAYYIQLEGSGAWYTVTAAKAPIAVLLNTGDKVAIEYAPAETGLAVPAINILVQE